MQVPEKAYNRVGILQNLKGKAAHSKARKKMSNILENKLNQTFTAIIMTMIKDNIVEILDAMPDGTLTPEERSSLLGMDVDNKVFAEDCANEIGISGAGIIPPFISAVNLKNDIDFFEQLDVIEAQLSNAVQIVSDLKRICAHEAMTTANAIYKMYEMANLAGIPGAKQGYDKLKERYKANGGANGPAPAPVI